MNSIENIVAILAVVSVFVLVTVTYSTVTQWVNHIATSRSIDVTAQTYIAALCAAIIFAYLFVV